MEPVKLSNHAKYFWAILERAVAEYEEGKREMARTDCLDLVYDAYTPRMVKLTAYHILAKISPTFEAAERYLKAAHEICDVMEQKVQGEIEDALAQAQAALEAHLARKNGNHDTEHDNLSEGSTSIDDPKTEKAKADNKVFKDQIKVDGGKQIKRFQDARERTVLDAKVKQFSAPRTNEALQTAILEHLASIHQHDPEGYAKATRNEDVGNSELDDVRGPDLPTVHFGDIGPNWDKEASEAPQDGLEALEEQTAHLGISEL